MRSTVRRTGRAAVAVYAEALERRALFSFFIDDASVIEGNSGQRSLVFTVGWSNSIIIGIGTVTATTSDGTASAAEGDYLPTEQQITFVPFGPRTQQFVVPVNGDTRAEPRETVVVTLSNPSGSDISDGTGVGTIRDDDPPTATIVPVAPDPREGPVPEVTVRFSEPVTGVDLSDFVLVLDDGPNLLTPAQTVTTTDGGTTWVLRGLAGVTGAPGQYLLALSGRGSTGIVDDEGNEFTRFAILEAWRSVPPPAPTNLAAYNLGDTDRLVFTDNATAEEGYAVERRHLNDPPNAWSRIADVPSANPSTTGQIEVDVPGPGAPPAEQFVYQARAYRTGADSANSNPALATPAGLRETIYDTTDLRDNPANPNDPVVRRDPDINHDFDAQSGGSPAPGKVDDDTFSIVWEGNFTPAQSGSYTLVGGSDDGMRVYLDGNLVVDAWVLRGYTETASAPQALTAGRKYELRVEFFENAGLAAATLKYEGPGINGRRVIPFTQLSPPTGAEVPRTPVDVTTTRVADCVTVWWHDLSASETGVLVQRSTSPAGGFATIGTAPGGADHFADPGPLTPGSTYYYRVRALGAGGAASAFSAPSAPVVPTAPGGAANFPTFAANNAAGAMSFNGTAHLVDRDGNGTAERLILTDALEGQAGSAYLTDPRRVDEFYAAFDFQITNSAGADGFTFILQAAPGGAAALGVGGGGLGYNGIPNSVAVKYDFWPFINQTGVYANGDPISDDPADPRNREIPPAFDLDNGQVYHTTLEYDSLSKTLRQTIDDLNNPATAPFTATYSIDIPAALGGDCAYIGFTGATGAVFARQEVLGMSFDNAPPAPHVQTVYVSGTAWAPAFKVYLHEHGMGSSDFGYAVPAGAAQTDNLPWNNVNQVSITFDRQVTARQANLAVRGVNVADYPVTNYAYDFGSRTATWTLGRTIGNDKVLLDLDADANGVKSGATALDGDFVTGAALPSGNGTPGGDFRFRLNVLPGDVNHNGAVNAVDLGLVRSRQLANTATPPYAPLDLGTLGGALSWPSGINDAGQVVGQSTVPGAVVHSHAFLYSGGTMRDLGTLGGEFSGAYGINNAGQITGYAGLPGDTTNHPFLYSGNGPMQDLITLSGGPPDTNANGMAINDSGQITGFTRSRSPQGDTLGRSYRYTAGAMINLGTLGGNLTDAYGINAAGQVVGFASLPGEGAGHAFLYTGTGALQDLGTLGGSDSRANGINAAGQIVGFSNVAPGSNTVHAFLKNPGGAMQDLGALSAFVPTFGYASTANAINASGRVVGSSYDAAGHEHAFLYAGGVMRDLNDLIAPGSGWTLTDARAINASGQIVGVGRTPAGQDHAYLLTPNPAYSPLLDVNGSGNINAVDLGVVRANQLKTLPGGTPTVAPPAGGVFGEKLVRDDTPRALLA